MLEIGSASKATNWSTFGVQQGMAPRGSYCHWGCDVIGDCVQPWLMSQKKHKTLEVEFKEMTTLWKTFTKNDGKINHV